MRHEEKRFYQLVKVAYQNFVLWKKKEIELKNKINLYLENSKEIYFDDKKTIATIEKIDQKLGNFYLEVRWKGDKDFIDNNMANCDVAKYNVKYVEELINKQEKLENTCLYKLCEETDFIQADWENQAKLASTILRYMAKNGEKLSERKCDIELLLVLYFYFRLTPVWFSNEAYTQRARVIENIIFPKIPIYEQFNVVFDAEKNSTDYWHMDFEYQKKLRHYHDQYSDIHRYWTEISDYIMKENKL